MMRHSLDKLRKNVKLNMEMGTIFWDTQNGNGTIFWDGGSISLNSQRGWDFGFGL